MSHVGLMIQDAWEPLLLRPYCDITQEVIFTSCWTNAGLVAHPVGYGLCLCWGSHPCPMSVSSREATFCVSLSWQLGYVRVQMSYSLSCFLNLRVSRKNPIRMTHLFYNDPQKWPVMYKGRVWQASHSPGIVITKRSSSFPEQPLS